MREETVRLPNGMDCAYISQGDGRPVVLIHGFGGSKEGWLPDIELLSRRYSVIAYDLMGHGRSRLPDGFPLTDTSLAEQLRGILEYSGSHDYTLIAHSLGACVVFQYVLKYGCELVDRVIIADMTPSMNLQPDWDLISVGGFGSRSALEWMERDYEGYMRAIVSAGGTQGLSEEEFERYFQGFMSTLQQVPVTRVLESCQADYRPALARFTVPAAYFYADPGTMLVRPAELAEYYQTHITAPCKLVPFYCNTHSFPQDMPEQFTSEVISFIENFN